MKNSLLKQIRALAALIVGHSVALTREDKVAIMMRDTPPEMTAALIDAVQAVGAQYRHHIFQELPLAQQYRGPLGAWTLDGEARRLEAILEGATAFIGFESTTHPKSRVGIMPEDRKPYSRAIGPIYEKHFPKDRWFKTGWPTVAMARQASIPQVKLRQIFLDACHKVDYAVLLERMKIAREFLETASTAQIIAPGTNLTFGLNHGVELGDGRVNLPGGLIMVGPVLGTTEGIYQSNVRGRHKELQHRRVKLTFEQGVIVHAEAGDQTMALNQLLDTDEGARRQGEAQFGCNSALPSPTTGITVYDENATATISIAAGRSHPNLPTCNGNKSREHLDLLLDTREEAGGGMMLFDDQPVIVNGEFVHEAFEGLRPENLLGSAFGV